MADQDTSASTAPAETASGETPPIPFEQALEELESLVERLEGGEGSLEQALADFERGIQLARQCEARLNEAEQTVQQLVGEGEEAQLAPFSPGEDDEGPRAGGE